MNRLGKIFAVFAMTFAIVASMAAAAFAHDEIGPPAIDCKQVTFVFANFHEASTPGHLEVSVNSQTTEFIRSIHSPGETITLDIDNLTRNKGTVTISAQAHWTADGSTVYGQRATAPFDCGEMPTTTTTMPTTTTTLKQVPVMPPTHHDYPPTTTVIRLIPPITVTATPTTQPAVPTASLPRTGGNDAPIAIFGAIGVLSGFALLGGSKWRKHSR